MSDDEIFFAALELETEEQRAELLNGRCCQDPEQRERVQRLLETHRRMQAPEQTQPSILDRSALVFQTFASTEELLPGHRVGKYILREQIGEGATSLVFRATQTAPLEGDVALKVLKQGMDSQRIMARFGLEHQVIGRLEHPGITRVLDVGVHDTGRPFFAMELVPDALTITRYAARFQLGLRDRIQLLIATCEIIQHAHQRGIIHRDIKPSNILIEGTDCMDPKPRIIDFGIAKIVLSDDDSNGFTTHGDRFGTPAYMSPEQALSSSSSLDIRSDVYSLGVVLYELLTGTTPRQASNASPHLAWTSESFWQYEIPSPSQMLQQPLKSSLSSIRELDLIVLKAIAREKAERYQTVADLHRDLQRYLDGEPIEAAGAGFFYRAKKLIAKNLTLSLATAITLITIIGTSILTASFALRAQKAEADVRLQLQETLNAQQALVRARDRAEAAMRQSQSLLRVFQVQTATDTSLTRFLTQQLEDAQLGRTAGQATDAPTINLQVGVLTQPHERLIVRGDWQWASSRFPTDLINTSFRLSSREAAQALPNSLVQTQSALSHPAKQSLGSQSHGDPQTALDRDSLQTILLEELRKMLPARDPFIAEVLDNCGLQALEQSQPEAAVQRFEESVEIWGSSPQYPMNLAQSQLFLAEAHLMNGQIVLARSLLNEAGKTLSQLPPADPEVAALANFLAQIQSKTER